MPGKGDNPIFPYMALDIYRRLRKEKQLYFLEAGHSGVYLAQPAQTSFILNEFIGRILGKNQIEPAEVKVLHQIREKGGNYEVILQLPAGIQGKTLAVDVFFKGENQVRSTRHLFSRPGERWVLEIPFEPIDIYTFRPAPPIEKMGDDQWDYEIAKEARAFYLLFSSPAASRSDLTEEEIAAIEVLENAPQLHYRDWLAEDFLWKRVGWFKRSVRVQEQLLQEDGMPGRPLHENERVKYLYNLYYFHKKYLEDQAKAERYLKKLLAFSPEKYYVRKAIAREMDK